MHTVILARHAESAFSVREAVNGDPGVSVPLTPLGEEQARALGRALADERIDVCITSEFERTRETARLALEGRDVPFVVLPELNDVRVGSFEGGPLADYRAWAHANGPSAEPPGGGESRAALVTRYVRAFTAVLARPEQTVLVVTHSLPIRYVLNAAEGRNPAAAMEQVEYAEPHRLTREDLERAVRRLDAWCAAPAF